VTQIHAMSDPLKVADRIVPAIVVDVVYLNAWDIRHQQEVCRDKAMNVPTFGPGVALKSNEKVSGPVVSGLYKRSANALRCLCCAPANNPIKTSHPPKIADFVEPFVPIDWLPLFLHNPSPGSLYMTNFTAGESR